MNTKIKAILSSVGLVTGYFLAQMAASVGIGIYYGIKAAKIGVDIDVQEIESIAKSHPSIILMSFVGLLFLLLVFKIKKVKIKEYISIKKININQMFLFICYGFGFQVVSGIANLTVNHFHNIEKSAESIQETLISGNIFTTVIIISIVLAPIIEELLFRGMILKKLNNHINTKLAIVIQAMLFSLIHFNISQLVPTLLLGIFLGICYIKFDNIIAPIIVHLVFNSIGITIMVIPESLQIYFSYVIIASAFASVILSMKRLESVKANS